MKLWVQWGILIIAFVFSYSSRNIWNMDSMEVYPQMDWLTAVMYTPFHFLVSFFCLIFFLLCVAYLIRRTFHELKVARMLRYIPYGSISLLVIVIGLYIQMLLFYGYLALGVSVCICIYEWIIYHSQPKPPEMLRK